MIETRRLLRPAGLGRPRLLRARLSASGPAHGSGPVGDATTPYDPAWGRREQTDVTPLSGDASLLAATDHLARAGIRP